MMQNEIKYADSFTVKGGWFLLSHRMYIISGFIELWNEMKNDGIKYGLSSVSVLGVLCINTWWKWAKWRSIKFLTRNWVSVYVKNYPCI